MTYRPEIDGLRAIAVLGVVIFHAKLTFFGQTLLPAGFLGVDIFFVISGYLITRIIMRHLKQGDFSFKDFYMRRARRILPALFLVMLVTIPFSWTLLLPHQYVEYSRSILATLGFASNILFWREAGYFAEPSHLKPLLHTWTLGVEEQYYIIFPLVFFLCWRFFKPYISAFLILSAVASFAIVLWAQDNYLIASFYLLPTRVWEFFIGALIAKREIEKGPAKTSIYASLLSMAGMVLIIVSMTCFDKTALHPGYVTLLPVIGSGLFIVFSSNKNILSKIVSLKLFVMIGLVSYSFYLWHQPLFAFANAYSIDSLTQGQKIILILIGLGLSYVSWRFVEQPFRNRDRVTVRPFIIMAVMCTIFLGSVALHGLVTQGAPDRIAGLPAIATKVTQVKRGYIVEGTNCYLNPCILGDKGKAPTLVLKGNSHAGIFAQSLHEALLKKNKSAHILSNGGTYIADESFPEYFGGYKRRNPLLKAHKEIIHNTEIEYVMISARMSHAVYGVGFDNGEGGVENLDEWTKHTPEQSKAIVKLFKDGIADLLNKNKKVVVVYPIPEVGWHVSNTLIKKFRQGEWAPLSTSYDLFKQRNAPIIDMLDSFGERKNLIRVYPHKIFCDNYLPDRCATHDDEHIFYFDTDHLSKAASDRVMQQIIKKMEEKWDY